MSRRRSPPRTAARFGFATPERPLVVEAVAVEATAPGEQVNEPELPARTEGAPEPVDHVAIWTGGAEHQAPVFERTALLAGDRIAGPALIREANATTVVEPGWTAEVTPRNHLLLHRTVPLGREATDATGRPDPVLLELFNNLFTNVAEQTGVVLANTSLSVNIKERLGLFLRHLRRGGPVGGQRAACSRASRRDGGKRAHGAAPPRRHAAARRRGGAEQPL